MKEVQTINYYPINEGAARRAKEMNSFSDYKEGSATAEYRAMVDKAAAISEAPVSKSGRFHTMNICFPAATRQSVICASAIFARSI